MFDYFFQPVTDIFEKCHGGLRISFSDSYLSAYIRSQRSGRHWQNWRQCVGECCRLRGRQSGAGYSCRLRGRQSGAELREEAEVAGGHSCSAASEDADKSEKAKAQADKSSGKKAAADGQKEKAPL